MRVAVVGGGLFGCTAAVALAKSGCDVDLYERNSDILDGATSAYGRLHSGYHYPRSDSTAKAARNSVPMFMSAYGQAVETGANHYYGIAEEDSQVDAAQYLAFLDRLNLPYEIVENPKQLYGLQLCVRVPEAIINIDTLRRLVRRDLRLNGVNVHLDRVMEPGPQRGHDLTVLATYGQPSRRLLRYEICEVVLVEVGRYTDDSYVILDGNYASLMRHGTEGRYGERRYLLYDVEHTVHASNVGFAPAIPAVYRPLLGPTFRRTPLTRFEAMTERAGLHLRMFDPAGRGNVIYCGSRFAVRAILPDVASTDERPTLVERDGDVVTIMSGKLCTAVAAAWKVVEELVPC